MQTAEKENLANLSVEEIKKLIALYPESKQLLSIKGTQNSYYQSIPRNPVDDNDEKYATFFEKLNQLLRKIYPTSSLPKDLMLHYDFTVSTAEHLSSITEPLSLNTVYNQAMYRQAHNSDYLLTLACSTIKVSNFLSPRSLHIGHSKAHLLRKKFREDMVLLTPPLDPEYSRENVQQCVTGLPAYQQEKLMAIWNRCLHDIADCRTFWEQICFINQQFWQEISTLNDLPLPNNYLMVPQEVLVQECLLDLFCKKKSNWLMNVLFTSQGRDRLLSAFNGIRGCWDQTKQKGTFLFWANVNRQPVPLWYADDALISEPYQIRINFTLKDITKAMQTQRIIPASSLSLLYLFFYLGLQVFGGILQCQYLPVMLKKILQDNQLRLKNNELERIQAMNPYLYLNFEETTVSADGMLHLVNPLPAASYEQYKKRSFQDEIQGCLEYLLKSDG